MPSQTTVSSWPLLKASIRELSPSLTVNTPKIVHDLYFDKQHKKYTLSPHNLRAVHGKYFLLYLLFFNYSTLHLGPSGTLKLVKKETAKKEKKEVEKKEKPKKAEKKEVKPKAEKVQSFIDFY
jgi:hypothetical protein